MRVMVNQNCFCQEAVGSLGTVVADHGKILAVKLDQPVKAPSGAMREEYNLFRESVDFIPEAEVTELTEQEAKALLVTVSKPRTLKELAEEVMDVQNACNLSGVVHAWSRSITELRAALKEQGITDTDAINRHPINILWIDKLVSLSGYDRSDRPFEVTEAYAAVEEIINPSGG